MTEQEFAKKCNVRLTTVKNWVDRNFIPGITRTDEGEVIIPNSARKPDTRARAIKHSAIIHRILYDAREGLGICSAVFDKTEAQFDSYINSLVEEKLITIVTEDNVQYYNITVKGLNYIDAKCKLKDNFVTLTPVMVGVAQLVLQCIQH